MKKIISLLIVLIMCISLCGCTNRDEIEKCEKLISSIGEVSLSSKNDIQIAEQAYNQLTNREQEKVSNYSDLVHAKSRYRDFLYQEYLDSIITEDDIKEAVTKDDIKEAVELSLLRALTTRFIIHDGKARYGSVRLNSDTEPRNCYISYASITGNDQTGWVALGTISLYDKYGNILRKFNDGSGGA